MGYKLVRPGLGEFLDNAGEPLVVAGDAEYAKKFFAAESGQRPEFVHSQIARGRIVYQRDIDRGDCPKGTEPGSTVFEFSRDDGRTLASGEIRVWQKGPLKPNWMIKPLGFKGDGFAVIVEGEKVGEATTYDKANLLREQAEKNWIKRWKRDVNRGRDSNEDT